MVGFLVGETRVNTKKKKKTLGLKTRANVTHMTQGFELGKRSVGGIPLSGVFIRQHIPNI